MGFNVLSVNTQSKSKEKHLVGLYDRYLGDMYTHLSKAGKNSNVL